MSFFVNFSGGEVIGVGVVLEIDILQNAPSYADVFVELQLLK